LPLWTHKGEPTDNQDKTEENNPCLGWEEKGTYCDNAENQKNETDIFGFFAEIEAAALPMMVTHTLHPLIFYEKDS